MASTTSSSIWAPDTRDDILLDPITPSDLNDGDSAVLSELWQTLTTSSVEAAQFATDYPGATFWDFSETCIYALGVRAKGQHATPKQEPAAVPPSDVLSGDGEASMRRLGQVLACGVLGVRQDNVECKFHVYLTPDTLLFATYGQTTDSNTVAHYIAGRISLRAIKKIAPSEESDEFSLTLFAQEDAAPLDLLFATQDDFSRWERVFAEHWYKQRYREPSRVLIAAALELRQLLEPHIAPGKFDEAGELHFMVHVSKPECTVYIFSNSFILTPSSDESPTLFLPSTSVVLSRVEDKTVEINAMGTALSLETRSQTDGIQLASALEDMVTGRLQQPVPSAGTAIFAPPPMTCRHVPPEDGLIGLVYLTTSPFESELIVGLTIHPSFRRRGIGAHVLRSALSFAFVQQHVHRVQALVPLVPGARLAADAAQEFFARAGFAHEGTRRMLVRTPPRGEWADASTFALLDTEWAPTAGRRRKGKSLWDAVVERHAAEQEHLLRLESMGLRRTKSQETIRAAPEPEPGQAVTVEAQAAAEEEAKPPSASVHATENTPVEPAASEDGGAPPPSETPSMSSWEELAEDYDDMYVPETRPEPVLQRVERWRSSQHGQEQTNPDQSDSEMHIVPSESDDSDFEKI